MTSNMDTSQIAGPSRQDITTLFPSYIVFIRKPLLGYITALKLHFSFISAPYDIQGHIVQS